MHDSPVTLFELFITNEFVNLICKKTNPYAAQKGNHSFKLDPKEFKSFIAVLLLSGYIPYPRRSMYWGMRDDSQNSIVDLWMFYSTFILLITKTLILMISLQMHNRFSKS